MSVESNSGAAHATAAVTWPSAEVAARLNPLPDCPFVFTRHRQTDRQTERETDGQTDVITMHEV